MATFARKPRLAALLCSLFCLEAKSTEGQSPNAPDSSDVRERRYFDFLIGKWRIAWSEGPSGTWEGGDEVLTFRRGPVGDGIESDWYFNRGTPAQPDFTNARYYSGYDNLTNTWSFYFVSPLSSQVYLGRKENGVWFFFRDFDIRGDRFLQRQAWRELDGGILERSIDNSRDGGTTWEVVRRMRFRRER